MSIKMTKNIGDRDRLIRAGLGVALLIVSYLTSSLIAFLFALFLFFEALTSWCGLYQIMGKNTCSCKKKRK